MAISRNLTIVFMFFYLGVIIYLMLFFLVPDFQLGIIKSRRDFANLTEGPNYLWVLIIAFAICLIGSASIGFPVPFPFVLFSLSNSVYMRYRNAGLVFNEILVSAPFWLEISGIAIAGGLGSILGEYTSYLIGTGARKIAEKRQSNTLENMRGFGRLVLENPKRTSWYIFVAAATPIPDDFLIAGLSMTNYPYWKCILPGWLGKNITTFFYCILPILISIGITAFGAETDDVSSVITEAIMLLVTLSLMFLIFAFDWNKYIENKRKEKAAKISEDRNE